MGRESPGEVVITVPVKLMIFRVTIFLFCRLIRESLWVKFCCEIMMRITKDCNSVFLHFFYDVWRCWSEDGNEKWSQVMSMGMEILLWGWVWMRKFISSCRMGEGNMIHVQRRAYSLEHCFYTSQLWCSRVNIERTNFQKAKMTVQCPLYEDIADWCGWFACQWKIWLYGNLYSKTPTFVWK